MSNILDARKKFLSILQTSGMDSDLKTALIDWAYNQPDSLHRRYPGLLHFLNQSFEFHYTTFDLIKCISEDLIERAAETIDDESQPVLIAEKHITYADRSFDIVNNYATLVRLEKFAKKCKLLNKQRVFIPNKQACNKQCIIGFVHILYRNNIFKNIYNLKQGSDKTVTFHDALLYCRERYHFGSLESGKKNTDNCVQKALARIPGLREFEEQNNQKNQLTFNKQKS